MIKGLFETHLFVENLEKSVAFYRDILKLKQCYFEEERRAAFFWIGKPKSAMLGLWEKPKAEIDLRHFAFRCSKEYILEEASNYLKSHGLKPYNFLNDGTDNPMVFTWMPAISIYFADPDGHYLEFISILEGESKPNMGIVTYEEWMKNS